TWPIVVTERGQGFAFKTPTALGIYLKRLRREPDAPDRVTLATHRDMKYATLIEFLYVCQKAGFPHIDVRNWRGESKPLDLGQGLNSNAGLSGSIELNERNFNLERSQFAGPREFWFETIDRRRLHGDWKVIGVLADGQSINQDDFDQKFITGISFTDRAMIVHRAGPDDILEFRIDPGHAPAWIDWRPLPDDASARSPRDGFAPRWPKNWTQALYRLNGNRLDIAFFQHDDTRRPTTDLSSIPARGSPRVVLNLIREQPKIGSPIEVIGKVSAFDLTHGLVAFVLSDPARVRPGSLWPLYRLGPTPTKPIALGMVEVLKVQGGEASGRVKLSDASFRVQMGDVIGGPKAPK
ncbi:MAG: hypothetical protein ACRD9W_23145, partial [Terriglobia bacterium]